MTRTPIVDLAESSMHAIAGDLSSAPSAEVGDDDGDGWGDD